MKTKHQLVFFLCCLAFALTTQAQKSKNTLLPSSQSKTVNAHRTCGSMDRLQEQLAANPAMRDERRAIETHTEAHTSQNLRSSVVVTIPVVFHIIHNGDAVGSGENIANTYIMAQLAQLNDDFRKLNSDIGSVPAAFAGLAADVEIQFCLAQQDPSGAATTGIIRHNLGQASWTMNQIDANVKPGTIWNRNSYLNIWTVVFGGGDAGTLGYAQFPGGTANTDGVVLSYTSVGSLATPFPGSAPYNKGRTATHEVGHWLNLYHIWGDDGTACTGSDQVADTPNQADENYGCPAFPQVSCSNGPNGDMFMNYMDYTDDACMYMFTEGQKTRAQALFATGGSRAALLNSAGCIAPYTCDACGGMLTTADITACSGAAALNFTPTAVNSTANALTAPSGSLATTDPIFNHPLEDLTGLATSPNGNTVYYDVFTFYVSADGNYTFDNTSSFDGFGILYEGSFSAAAPLSNIVAINDDENFPTIDDPNFTVPLQAGQVYYLVTTSYANNTTGTYSWTITPPAGAQLQDATSCVIPTTGYNYTYLISNSSGNIVGQSNAPVNMTAYSAGTYTVCGLSYTNTGFVLPLTNGTVNLATWSATLTGIDAPTCGDVSTDCIAVTINNSCCPTLNVGATGNAGAICSGASVSSLLTTAAASITLTGGTIPTDATIAWFDDAAFTIAATTAPTNTTCASTTKTYYAQATCVNNTSTKFAAGSVTVTIYPAPAGFTVTAVAGSCGVAAKAELRCGGSLIGTAETGTVPTCAAPSQPLSGTWTATEIAAAIGGGATASCYSDITYGPIAAVCAVTPTATVTTTGTICVTGTGISTLNLSTLVTAGNTSGTWSIVTASGTTLSGTTLSAGTAIDGATATVRYTITGTDCPNQTYDAVITVNDCTTPTTTLSADLSDPCFCITSPVLSATNTVTAEGTFGDELLITTTPPTTGLVWTVTPTATPAGANTTVGAVTDNGDGTYRVAITYSDAATPLGWSVSAAQTGGTQPSGTFPTQNTSGGTCTYYPIGTFANPASPVACAGVTISGATPIGGVYNPISIAAPAPGTAAATVALQYTYTAFPAVGTHAACPITLNATISMPACPASSTCEPGTMQWIGN